MNITLDRKVFKASAHCAPAKCDVRYYLNGVCLRLDGNKGQAYATDGHVLFACSFDIDDDAGKGPFDITVPMDAVKHAAKGKTPKVKLSSLDDGAYMLDGLRFVAVEGKFPDISRVIPAKYEPSIGNYNPDLLVRCNKALQTWFETKGEGNTRLYQNGLSAAIMQGRDNSGICVIMPIRVDKDVTNKPYSFTVMVESKAAAA